MFIDDCVEGIQKIMYSDIKEPLNLGSSEMVSINELTDITEEIAGYKMTRHYDLGAPKGVRGRNSDNTLILELLGWEPTISLHEGMTKTFNWIKGEMVAAKEANSTNPHSCNCH
jgi:nucleoside-diphosphate-sugar epimerase